jgi:quercetin dioxygenase-like cupin family protein
MYLREVLMLFTFCTGMSYAAGSLAHGGDPTGPVTSVSGETYHPVSRGTRKLALGEVTIRMLVEASNIGRKDIEVGELFLPVGSPPSVSHPHTSLEIFYVVQGILGHEVNGKMYRLNPGDVGFLKPGDQVVHSVLSDGPVEAVVIWVPGGEADAMVGAGFVEVPLN